MMLLESQIYAEPSYREEPIVIGLVNNMPDAALRSTERQFHSLLSQASHNRVIRLRYFTLPELPHAEAARSHISQKYEDLSELWLSGIDGLIVTGTEPRAAALTDEPYWNTLTKLIDWAADHTISTVWSCLAAHAAVLHLDGIKRRRLPRKLSGVFGCAKYADHSVVAGIAPRWCVPHSRYNELPEEMLISRGYRVLSRSDETGADLFVGHRDSLDLFFQGHPEYEPDTLLREYRRDVGQYLASEKDIYPEMPFGYFDESAVAALTGFHDQCLSHRDENLLSKFPVARVDGHLSYSWREPAARIYANWMSYLAERKYHGSRANNHRQ
jgi:homoserine O-succinyltransferase